MTVKEERIWKALTIIVALLGVAVSFFCYWDGKRSAENKIAEVLSDRYEFIDKEMSYEQALEEVGRHIKTLETDNGILLAKNDDLENEVSELKKKYDYSQKVAQAESYATSGNYEVAIPILNSISEKAEDVVALLKDYTVKYEGSIVNVAEELADEGNFDEAVTLINEALEIVPNSQILLDKKNSVTPQYLVDAVECYKAENLWRLDSKEHMKINGKSYSYRHAIYSQQSDLAGSMFNNAYSANAFYNLDGKYSQLSGIAGHIDFSGSGTIGMNDGGRVYDAEITIWGDDEEIITIPLLSTDPAKDFNVSIEGVKILEFQIKCSGNSKVGIAEIQIR